MIFRYVLIVFIIVIIFLQFIRPSSPSTISTGSNWSNQDFGDLNFAWEDVPMDWKYILNQERLDRELLATRLNYSQFALTHKRQWLYLDYIQKSLKKSGIPSDFQYLPMIESYLKETVISAAGAAGMRQFMPWTAIKYWLIVNEFVDQRFDPFLSTDAAMLYLKDLYAIFNNWTLALAAYNRWEYGLQSDMQNQFQSWYYDLYLNNETHRFVFRALAMKYLMQNRYSYFDPQILWEQYSLPNIQTIQVWAIQDLRIRAKDNWHSYLQVKQLNPRIRKNLLPDGKRAIRVFKD